MDGELLADQPLGQKLIKKGFWLYFFTLFIGPAGYIIRAFISNTISVQDVGIIYSILSFMGIIATYHDLGFTEALQYHLPKYWITKQYNAYKTSIYFTLVIQAISGIIIALFLFFGANYLAVNYFHSPESIHIIKIFCIYFLSIIFHNMIYSIYSSFQDIIQSKLMEFIKVYSTLAFTLCFFGLGILNITNFTRARIIGTLASLAISFIIFLKKYRYTLNKGVIERDINLIKKQSKYALWVFIGTNIAVLLSQIDQQFVIYFLGPQAAGYYANYLSLILSFSIITGPLLVYLFPLTTELMAKGQNDKLILLKNLFYKYFSVFAISISGLFIVFGKEIVTTLFGEKFIYSGILLQYSALFLVFNILFSINFGFLAGMGKVKERAKIIFTTLIINIILNFIAVKTIGLIGVVFTLNISRILLCILSFRLINRDKSIKISRKYIGINVFRMIAICLIFYYFKDKIFILQDSYRYKNLLYLMLITIIYYLYILGINYKSILIFKSTIQDILKFRKIKTSDG